MECSVIGSKAGCYNQCNLTQGGIAIKSRPKAIFCLLISLALGGCGTASNGGTSVTPSPHGVQSAKAVPINLVLHLQDTPPTASFNAVWQNRDSGSVGGFPLSWATNTKQHPDTYTYRTRLVPGDYRLGVYESGLEPGASIGAVASLHVPPTGGQVNLRLQAHPFKTGTNHKTAVVGTVVGPDGKPTRDGLVLAMPVGTGSLFQAAAHTAADGSFRLTLPSQGVYDLFAVQPGNGGVGAAAVGTLTHGTAHVKIHLPSWQGRRYVVVLQQGLAYTGKPVWVWGNLPGKAPDLALKAMPGVQTLLTVHLPAKNGLFTWSGVLRTQQQYENLTATYAIQQGTDLVAAFTLPGVPTGSNGNDYWPENVAPYHLAWGSASEAGGKVRFDIGGSAVASPWGLFPRPDGQVPLPVGIGSPWAQTVAYMPVAIPSQPLLSVYDVQGGPLVPPKDSWLGGFRLSSGRDFPLGLQGAQFWSVDMLTASAGWATTRDNQVLTTNDGGATWLDVTPEGMPNVGPAMVSLASTGPNHAWLAVTSYSETPTVVYYTSDGGQTWQSVATYHAAQPQTYFMNKSTGFLLLNLGAAAGSEAVLLLRTTDGGKHWTIAADGRFGAQHAANIFGGDKSGFGFSGLENGWLTGTWAGNSILLYVTHDGGTNWNAQSLTVPQGLTAAGGAATSLPPVFFGPNDGVMPVEFYPRFAVFYQTTDGGQSWAPTTPVKGGIGTVVYSVVDASHIFVIDGTKIYRTADGGLHWTTVTPNLSLQGASALDFVSPFDGWAIAGGQLLWTTDGGSTWTNLSADATTQK